MIEKWSNVRLSCEPSCVVIYIVVFYIVIFPFYLQAIKTAQDGFWEFMDEHRNIIKLVVIVVCLMLYFAYFIYALIYHFGDEGSIR